MDTLVLSCEEVSAEMLAKLFQEAYFEATVDPDGDVKVKENYNFYLRVDKERGLIRYHCAIRLNEASNQESRLKYVNRVAAEVILVRALLAEKSVIFSYYLVIQGGVTPRTIIMAFKRFASCVSSAIQADKESVLG